MVCTHNRNTDFYDMISGVLHGDILATYLFILCLDYVLQMPMNLIRENCFTIKWAKWRRYPVETMIDADYTDHLVIFITQIK